MRITNRSELSIIEATVTAKIEKLGLVFKERNKTENVVYLEFDSQIEVYYLRPQIFNLYDLHYIDKQDNLQVSKFNNFSELYQFMKTSLDEIVNENQ